MKIKFNNVKGKAEKDNGTTATTATTAKEELAAKVKGFKFQSPKPKSKTETKIAKGTLATKSAPLASKGNAEAQVVRSTAKSESQMAPTFAQPHPAIPEMSVDKYEVVVGQIDEFSEVAGNRFEEQVAILQAAVDGTGDLKDGMTNILTFLDDNPQYKETIEAKDMHVFVNACAKIAGITVMEKKARKTKRAKTSELEADIMNDLADLVIDL